MTDDQRLPSAYHRTDAIARAMESGDHRGIIGGMWDEIGRLQFDLLVDGGLQPCHRMIDLGCGSFRGGVHFAGYLDAGNYFGADINASIMEAGYDRELMPLELDKKVPRTNLLVTDAFDVGKLKATFDYALALSLFTHLPINLIRTCLEKLRPTMTVNGRFFATFFVCDDGMPLWRPISHPRGGITTYGDADPYHYRVADIEFMAGSTGWHIEKEVRFNHPRSQRCFMLATA
ncbi:class I SAM-dependent methyltransferase [Mesorhizobium sp. B2-3-10]|uniref:class I SAM-dependent methyltransferase n=1 Tax=Mesorhizobium sp. B2-3-10 TaxID=2589954 RepID=UPI00112C7213|nr:class I SAM-dependent methyltransferase [Mesorhizobium sp. B2-3-10]TPL92820.1 class I SAM-dependent methyltransferase [Mesorhizobium sp. B2-3-10]